MLVLPAVDNKPGSESICETLQLCLTVEKGVLSRSWCYPRQQWTRMRQGALLLSTLKRKLVSQLVNRCCEQGLLLTSPAVDKEPDFATKVMTVIRPLMLLLIPGVRIIPAIPVEEVSSKVAVVSAAADLGSSYEPAPAQVSTSALRLPGQPCTEALLLT